MGYHSTSDRLELPFRLDFSTVYTLVSELLPFSPCFSSRFIRSESPPLDPHIPAPNLMSTSVASLGFRLSFAEPKSQRASLQSPTPMISFRSTPTSSRGPTRGYPNLSFNFVLLPSDPVDSGSASCRTHLSNRCRREPSTSTHFNVVGLIFIEQATSDRETELLRGKTEVSGTRALE